MSLGDKHGDGKFEYAAQNVRVSIVWYDRIVPKEDRSAMTPEVCFNFCRTVPDALFFGISEGRNCYCTPYFKREAGDSSQCDAVCEGEPSSPWQCHPWCQHRGACRRSNSSSYLRTSK